MKKQAFAYLRVSSQGQIDGDGFDRQLDAIQGYARNQGYEIIQIFRDEGISGTAEERPALAKLMVSLAENGNGTETVIIERMDRLARDLMVQEIIVNDLQKRGFNLISSYEGDDLINGDPTRTLIRQVLGAISQYEKTMLVSKLKAARERKRAKGEKCEGRKSYAEIAPEVIKEARKLRRKPPKGRRRTYAQIAEILSSKGLRTISGKPFNGQVIADMLRPKKR